MLYYDINSEMDNFFDLKNSTLLTDQIIFDLFCRFIITLFNVETVEKDKTYVYNSQLENEKNHQFIRDNWNLMFLFQCHTEYNHKAKRLVFQILNAMISHLNERYHFKQPIRLDQIRQCKRPEHDKTKTTTITHHDLKLN